MFTWPFAAQALALRKSKGRTHPHGNMGLMVWGSTPRDFRFAGTVALHLDVNQSLITPKKLLWGGYGFLGVMVSVILF